MKTVELCVLVLVNVMCTLQFSLLAPIIPLEVKRRHISQIFTGLIMGCLCIGYFFSPCLTTEVLIPRLG